MILACGWVLWGAVFTPSTTPPLTILPLDAFQTKEECQILKGRYEARQVKDATYMYVPDTVDPRPPSR
jgi:hypothetical protein